MKILLGTSFLFAFTCLFSMQQPPSGQANKEQKKDLPLVSSPFKDTESDSFWDEVSDTAVGISEGKLQRFKNNKNQPSPRSALAIAQQMKENPDAWPYDSDEANEIIKELENEESKPKGH